jgi:hypothetical protein
MRSAPMLLNTNHYTSKHTEQVRNGASDAGSQATGQPRRASYMQFDPEAMEAMAEQESAEVEAWWNQQFSQLSVDTAADAAI